MMLPEAMRKIVYPVFLFLSNRYPADTDIRAMIDSAVMWKYIVSGEDDSSGILLETNSIIHNNIMEAPRNIEYTEITFFKMIPPLFSVPS